MRIRYLGTAAAEGWPALFCHCESCNRARVLGGKNIRTRSQAVLDDTLLIDFPPDTYLHMLRGDLDLPRIDHILITHTHEDHLYLPDISRRHPIYANGVTNMLSLYGNDALVRAYQKYEREQAGPGFFDGIAACKEIAPFIPVKIEGYTVTPLLANHNKKERCYLYLIERDGRTLFYGNDTGIFPEETWAYLSDKHLNLVSLDCTFCATPDGNNHMGLPDVFTVQDRLMAEGIADSDTVFIVNHFSHNGLLLHNELEALAGPRGILVSYDGMEIDV